MHVTGEGPYNRSGERVKVDRLRTSKEVRVEFVTEEPSRVSGPILVQREGEQYIGVT